MARNQAIDANQFLQLVGQSLAPVGFKVEFKLRYSWSDDLDLIVNGVRFQTYSGGSRYLYFLDTRFSLARPNIAQAVTMLIQQLPDRLRRKTREEQLAANQAKATAYNELNKQRPWMKFVGEVDGISVQVKCSEPAFIMVVMDKLEEEGALDHAQQPQP